MEKLLDILRSGRNLDHQDSELTDFSDLYENTLYSTQAEKDALLNDKEKVALAFTFNFFGMLGIVNAASPKQLALLKTYLKDDKKLRISSIDDTNHDISLSVKLAYEAGFFKSDTIVNEITRFLVKLKAGQVDQIDSKIVWRWIDNLKPEFFQNIPDSKIKQSVIEFRDNKGETVDISRLTFILKKKANKYPVAGDFQPFAKRFNHLKELIIDPLDPNYVAPQAGATTLATIDASPVNSPDSVDSTDSQDNTQQTTDDPVTPVVEPEPVKSTDVVTQEIFDTSFEFIKNINYSSGVVNVSELLTNTVKVKVLYEYSETTHPIIKSFLDKCVSIIESITKVVNYYYTADSLKNIFDQIKDTSKEIESLTGFEFNTSELFNSICRTTYSPSLVPNIIIGYWLSFGVVLETLEIAQTRIYNELIESCFKYNLINLRERLLEIVSNRESNIINIFINYAFEFDLTYSSSLYEYSDLPEYIYFAFDLIEKVNNKDKSILQNYLSEDLDYSNKRKFFMAYGLNQCADNLENIQKEYIDKGKNMVKGYLEDISSENLFKLLRQLKSRVLYIDISQGGLLLDKLHDVFGVQIMKVGLKQSEFYKIVDDTDYTTYRYIKFLGIDLDEVIKKFPDDMLLQQINLQTNGINNYSKDQLSTTILKIHKSKIEEYGSDLYLVGTIKEILGKLPGEKEPNINKLTESFIDIVNKGTTDSNFDKYTTDLFLKDVLPYTSSENTVGLFKVIQSKKLDTSIFNVDSYKLMSLKGRKEMDELYSSIVQDTIGSEVEDYMNEVISELPYNLIMKIRNNLVGGKAIINEINNGEIKPYDKIDAARLKKIFLYNEINMAALVKDAVGGKKKKAETIMQYYARVIDNISQQNGLLDELKIKVNEEDTKNVKTINKLIIERDHAGRHGNVYPLITKVYDCHLTFQEFEEFRKNNFGDGSIIPAYHGTGGIAAGMILRYGFKVIKSTDPSVVGRMLGDGIYFSNKIDKSLQYVSNGGYSRQDGQKGYILSMDTNLGKKGENYNSAGTGTGDGIRSPEWCVFDAKSQTKIMKVYEVTLVKKHVVDKYLNESDSNSQHKPLKFKKFLNEEQIMKNGNTASYIFRDGMIPIVDKRGHVTYKDFEDALKDKDITKDMFDISRQGPMIVFRNTQEQFVCDERYASHLMGKALSIYKDEFIKVMYRDQN